MTRRRYRWNEERGELEEINLDAPITPRVELQTGAHYDGLRAQDGTPIDTRRRHAEYMKRNNFVLVDDFKQTWAEAPKRRAAELGAGRREAVARTIHRLENGKRR